MNKLKLDVDPRRDDDASPMSSYRYMLRLMRLHVVVVMKTFPLMYPLLM